MKIFLKTYVEQSLEEVIEGFNKDLFIKLKPPGVGLKLLRYEGSETGDVVEMKLNFGLFKQRWKSVITDHGSTDETFYFVDEGEGKDLPFFLTKWRHKHLLQRKGQGTEIIDDIFYQSPIGLNLLMYPAMYLQFAYRKPIYRKTFRKKYETKRQ